MDLKQKGIFRYSKWILLLLITVGILDLKGLIYQSMPSSGKKTYIDWLHGVQMAVPANLDGDNKADWIGKSASKDFIDKDVWFEAKFNNGKRYE